MAVRMGLGSCAHWRRVVAAVHQSRAQFVLTVTGGGAEAVSALTTVPGASATVLAASVPYSATASEKLVGQASVTAPTAAALAYSSYTHALELLRSGSGGSGTALAQAQSENVWGLGEPFF